MKRSTGRPRSGQEPLTRERILERALALVDQLGVEKFSMRRLAAELGVDPMSIYHHLPGKSAVIRGVTEQVFSTLKVPARGGTDWRAKIRSFARAYHRLLSAHPSLLLTFLVDGSGEPVMATGGAAALEANEILIAALAEAGLPPHLVLRSADLVVDYVNSQAFAERLGHESQEAQAASLRKLLEAHPPERFPAQRALLAKLGGSRRRAGFDEGLEIIIAGIEATARGEEPGA